MKRMWGVKKVFSFMFLALTISVLLTACGGGGGGSDGGGGNNDGGGGGATVKQGRFIDSPVGGLRYISGSQSGFTNAQGTFNYDDGAIVQFFIGDIVIGGGAAASIMTPVNLVQGAADETNPTVTNIARFLQTLDDDGNPSNGITITTAVNNLAVGRTINFNQSIANFGNDPNVQTVVSALTAVTSAGTRPLVLSSSAQNNLRAAILGILSGNYSGTFSGDASGTWTMVIDSSGNINGTAVNSDSSTAAGTGTVGSNGTAIMGIVATGATFSGTITLTGQVSGTWVDISAGESGTFSGSKQSVTSATLVSIAVTPVNPSIANGTTQQFTATGTYSDSSTQNITASVTWSSSNTTRATINASGLATALAAGSTTITATSGSISGNTTLTVTSATLVSIAVTPANPSIAVSTTQQFTATGTYSDSSTQNITASVTWSSSDTTTATINASGLATALAAGSTTITATSGSIFGNTTLTVTSGGGGNTVTDIDGNVYNTVTIGTQVWMKENLKVTRYRDGTDIGTTGQWAYNNDVNNVADYGRLYTWYAATDSRGLCPTGWHVPTDAEWTTLTDYLGGLAVAGGKMKEAGTTHWLTPNTGADNSSGFTALPGGHRISNGVFNLIGNDGYWWSATEYSAAYAWYRGLFYSSTSAFHSYYHKNYGYSVRCIRD